MNEQRMSDARLAAGLRAAMPASAPGGSAARLAAGLREASQVRALPLGLGVFTDVDPAMGSRPVMLAAALLVALLLATLAALGALGLWPPRTHTELSVEPPGDPQAYVVQVVQDSPVRRPMAFTVEWDRRFTDVGRTVGPGRSRVFVDGDGSVRIERFDAAFAPEPDTWTLHTAERSVTLAHQGAEPVWIEGPGVADPRFWIYLETAAYLGTADTGCEATELDPTAGWRYVGLEEILGRPVHHLRCGGDLWVDVETRLVLRSQGPFSADGRSGDSTRALEVTSLDLAPQPPALFDTTAPAGIRHVTTDEQLAYEEGVAGLEACAADPICSAPEVPLVTPPTAVGVQEDGDLAALLEAARVARESAPPLHAVVSRWRTKGGDAGTDTLDYDGPARWRIDAGIDPVARTPAGSTIQQDEDTFIVSRTGDDGSVVWQDMGGPNRFRGSPLDDLLPPIPPAEECSGGWRYLGVDRVGSFVADHVACAELELWIDRGTRLVVRRQWPEGPAVSVREVVELAFGPVPTERFQLPPGVTPLPPPSDDPKAPHTPAPQQSSGS